MYSNKEKDLAFRMPGECAWNWEDTESKPSGSEAPVALPSSLSGFISPDVQQKSVFHYQITLWFLSMSLPNVTSVYYSCLNSLNE